MDMAVVILVIFVIYFLVFASITVFFIAKLQSRSKDTDYCKSMGYAGNVADLQDCHPIKVDDRIGCYKFVGTQLMVDWLVPKGDK